ncbi:RNA polymerase sigma factor, sigma-70 family [Streptomyces sp. MnatMP-M77]|nr:RNA polymerase sigma factor, sigma-70 family [Streptomyces sp. MnatMP-M77]
MSLTFLEAWRLRHKLHGDVDNVRAWLLGIATNVLRNSARTARRHSRAMARLPASEDAQDFADEVVGQLADAQRLAATAKALSRLKRSEREVFTLVVWSGLSYAATAEALGLPTGTVRSRLSRARTKLRRLRRAVLAEHTSRPHRVVEAEDPWRDRAQGARGGSTEAVHDWWRATASVEPGGPPDPHHARTETGRDGGRRRRHRRHAGRPRIVPAVRRWRHVDPVGRLSRHPGRDPDLRPSGPGRRGHQSDTRRGQGGARQDHGPAVDRRRRGLAPGGHCFPVLPASREPDVSGPPRPAVRSPAAGRVHVLPVPRRGG